MKAKNSIRKSKLAKTMFLMTCVLVAAMFIGSAAAVGLRSTGTVEQNQQTTSPLSVQKNAAGLAPHTNKVVQQPYQPSSPFSRGYFYAYNAYDPNGMPNAEVTFDMDAVVNQVGSAGINFISGEDREPDNGPCYGVAYGGGLYSIDLTTGVFTSIASTIPLNSMTLDTTTGTWYVSGSSPDGLLTIDITTGATTYVGSYGMSNIMISIFCDKDGNMYGYDVLFGGNSHLYSIDKNTGAATIIGDMGHNFCYAQDGRVDRNDGTCYLAAYDIGQGQSYLATCDLSTAAVTIVNIFNPTGIEIDGFAGPDYSLVKLNNDVGVSKILAPASGNAGVITPKVTVKNYGNYSEYSVPVNMKIVKNDYTDYMNEHFDGTFPPAGWSNMQTSDYWVQSSDNYAGGSSPEAVLWYYNNFGGTGGLQSGYVDTSSATSLTLTFRSYIYYWGGPCLAKVEVTGDGGATWNDMSPWPNPITANQGPKQYSIDISAYIGTQTGVRFTYSGQYYWMYYWAIDDVRMFKVDQVPEYDQTIYTDIYYDQSFNVTFPDWTPSDLGASEYVNKEYVVNATTQLNIDEKTSNDYKQKTINLHYGYFNDVAIAGINSPQDGLAATQPVQVVLKNNGQNNENVDVNVQIGLVSYNTLLTEDFTGGVPPAGWGTDIPSNWYSSPTNYAGGTAPEAVMNYYPSQVGEFHFYTYAIDTTGWTSALFKYKEYVNDYNGQYTLKIQTQWTGSGGWVDAYSRAGGPYGPTETQVTLGTANGLGAYDLVISFSYVGDLYNINYWYIDDVWFGQTNMATEYDQTVNVNINAGQTMNVDLPDWTPLDLPALYDEDYLVTASASLNGINVIGSYGFEDYVPGSGSSFPPTGWGNFDNDGNYNTWYGISYYYYAHSGNNAAYCYNYGTPEDNWLVSDQKTVPGDGGAGFSIWDTTMYGSYGMSAELWFCPNGNTPYDFLYNGGVLLGYVYPYAALPNWQYDWASTTSIAGQTGWFAVRDTTYDTYDYIFLDDITFPDGSTQGFEPVLGYFPDWTSYQIVGSDTYNMWDGSSYSSYPPYMSPHSGTYMAWYNSYLASYGDQARLESNDPLDLSSLGYSSLQGSLWMYHDNWYSGCPENVQVQVYDVNNPGAGWQNVGDPIYRYDAMSPGWTQSFFDLSPYATTSVYFGFLATSYYGSAMAIDDIALAGLGAIDDGYPADNSMSELITLSYIHDVGVTAITEPSGPPAKDITWFTYGGDNYNSIGLTTGGTFEGAIRLTPTELAPFDGNQIVSVKYCHGMLSGSGEPATDGYMKIYGPGTATAPGALLVSEPFSTPSGNDWFQYNFVNPVTVDATQDLWFSVEVDNTPAGAYPLGVDAGPAVDGKADWVSMDGVTWIELQIYGLDYNWNHMVGFEPYVPPSVWPPATYPVKATVKNIGVTFPEIDIPVEAKITHVDNSTVIYDETITIAGPLAPGASVSVTFPDVTIYNLTAWEGKYKVEIWTALGSDEVPGNNKKSMTFQIGIIDVIPPITNHSITGTMGLEGWYVSNVVITLTAIDPAPPVKFGPKPPSGVAHTYYKLHAADPWILYTGSPVIVNTSGTYELFYYSDDVAGNVEAQKGPFNFKMDKTAPTITLTVMSLNALKTKWLLNATVADANSGVAKVEFYVDDVLVGNATAYPYTYTYKGKGKVAQAIVYDHAGNSAMSLQVNEYIPDYNSQQLLNPNTQQLSFQQILLQK